MSNEDWQGLSAWKQETFMVRNGLSARYSLSFISLMLSFKSLLHVSFPASCNFVFSAGVLPFRWTIHENLDAFTPFKVEADLTSKSLGIFLQCHWLRNRNTVQKCGDNLLEYVCRFGISLSFSSWMGFEMVVLLLCLSFFMMCSALEFDFQIKN